MELDYTSIQTDEVPSPQVGPAIVEEIFTMLFKRTYEEGIGTFKNVDELIAAFAAVVRNEFGSFVTSGDLSDDGNSSRLH